MKIIIASFDIGKCNFAQYIEKFKTEDIGDNIDEVAMSGKRLQTGVYDFTDGIGGQLTDAVRLEMLEHLNTDEKKIAYQLSDGERNSRDIAEIVGVSHMTIRQWWNKWFELDFIEQTEKYGKGRYKRLISLSKMGIPNPDTPNVSKMTNNVGEDCRKIMQEIRDYIYKNRKFPSYKIVSDITKIPYNRCKERIDLLTGQGQLYPIVDGSQGVPTIIVPSEMISSIFYTQTKPDWVEAGGYRLKEAIESVKIQQKLAEKIKEYDMLENLLYATGTPLEEAVTFALNYLDFSNVVHHFEDKNNADVTFEHDGKKYLTEIEGTNGSGDKEKVLQLNGWMVKELDSGRNSEDLIGIFVVNHEREKDPEKRGSPLTEKAIEYMKYYRFKLITTPFLYSLVTEVHQGKRIKAEVRELLVDGLTLQEI